MRTTRLIFHLRILFPALVILSSAGSVCAQNDREDRNQFTSVTMRVTHRIYPSFADTLSVGKLDTVQIGDTEFSFVVDQFLADFGIKADGTLVSRSAMPHNPAFEVVVFEEDQEVDRNWAFFGTGKPHYRRDSMLAFEVLYFHLGDQRFTQSVPRKDTAR